MDERTAQPEAEKVAVASDVITTSVMTSSSISDLSYFRRQVNESLMKLQRSLLGAERQDGGGGHVTPESPNTASGPGEVRLCFSLFVLFHFSANTSLISD